jgi:predicted Zn-dependent protease
LSTVAKFSRADELRLDAAEGWLGLGDVVSANAELDEISREFQEHPAVLLLRCDICSKAKRWEAVAALAGTLVNIAPRERQAWIHRSFALHEMKRTQEAHDLLRPAADKFPKFWLVPYNLACYCAQLGQLPEARQWLEKAITLGDAKTVKAMARDDADLAPIRRELSE